MKLKHYFILMPLCCFLMASCGDDDIDCTDTSRIDNINTNIAEASDAFSMDPSNSENCNAFKDAIQELFDVIEEFDSCFSEAEREQLEDQSTALQTQLDDIEC